MLKTKELICAAALSGCLGILTTGCVGEEDTMAATSEQSNVTVQMNVGTRAVSETTGALTEEEGALHSLRVYAFVDGKLVGHHFDNVSENKSPFYMDLKMTSTTTEDVNFYVVANEAAMSTSSVNPLTENTTETALNTYSFTSLNNLTTYGLPMYYKGREEIDFSKDAKTNTDPDHKDHTVLEQSLDFELARPVGKLGVFVAIPAIDDGAELTITGMKMLQQGTRVRNYLMPQTEETLKGMENSTGDITLTPITDKVTTTLAENADRTDASLYEPVLEAPFYPFENPWENGGAWNVPGDDGKENVLEIKYQFTGDVERTGLVYMPKIERNNYYQVLCLIHNTGDISVEYLVADWDDGDTETYVIDEVSYEDLVPWDETIVKGTDGKYPQPEIYVTNNNNSDEGTYSFKFTINGPAGLEWTPVLYNADDEDYTIDVFEVSDDDTEKEIAPTNSYYTVPVGTSETNPVVYRIRIRANNGDNAGKSIEFAISYNPTWLSTGSSLFDIKGTDWAHDESDDEPSYDSIIIKQVDN